LTAPLALPFEATGAVFNGVAEFPGAVAGAVP
jgi:hypothetical protein